MGLPFTPLIKKSSRTFDTFVNLDVYLAVRMLSANTNVDYGWPFLVTALITAHVNQKSFFSSELRFCFKTEES